MKKIEQNETNKTVKKINIDKEAKKAVKKAGKKSFKTITMWAIIDNAVQKLSNEEKLMIWLASDSFSEWEVDVDYDDDCDDAFSGVFPEGYDHNGVIQTIYDDVIGSARDYRNNRITDFLERGYEF